jgi:hypothetical protein
MNKERSYLAINVFPYMRKRMVRRGVNFSWTDLRWGITNEDAQAGLVIPKCLQSINSCDIFIGIIGDYYGTTIKKQDVESYAIPAEIKSQILKYFDSSETNDTSKGMSITEIEIAHGVFNKKEFTNVCFFFKETNSIKDSRLSNLIKRIKKGGYRYYEYSSCEQLGRFLSSFLDEIIPNPIIGLGEYQSESMVQKTILESYFEDFHNETEYESLNQKLNRVKWDNNRGFYNHNRFYHGNNHAVIGNWGCGKSSYIANWIKYLSQVNECHVVYYFINTYSSYNTPIDIALYLSYKILNIDEFKKSVDINKIDEDPVKRLQHLLSLSPYILSKPLVIALDGADNLKDNTESSIYAKSLEWIGHVHPYVFLLISSQESDYSISHFRDLEIEIQLFQGLNKGMIRDFAMNYLNRFHKSINSRNLNRIICNTIYNNPLLLTRFLDLLISCDDNDSLTETIDAFTLSNKKESFISLYFERLANYFPSWYKDMLSYLAVSRNGLFALELGCLLHQNGYVPTKEIAEICAMLDDFISVSGTDNLIHTNCHLKFKNDIVKHAVVDYLRINNEEGKYRRNIIEVVTKDKFVDMNGDELHLYAELLHQLYEIKDYCNLHRYLLIPDYILKMRNSKDYLNYWTAIYNERYGSLTDYLTIPNTTFFNDLLYINYANKIVTLAKNVKHYNDSSSIINLILNELRRRHILSIDDNGYFTKLTTELASLIIAILEVSNENREITDDIYSLYKPFLLTLQDKGNLIRNNALIHYYTYTLYCDTLLIIGGNKQENRIYNLLQKVFINSNSDTTLTYEGHQFVSFFVYLRLLQLASIASTYYKNIIVSLLSGGNNLYEAINIVSSVANDYKLYEARLYEYAYLSGMTGWDNDYEYLDKATKVLEEVESTGGINVNKDFIICYLLQYQRYRVHGENDISNKYKDLIRGRLKYKWDIPPSLLQQIDSVLGFH